MSYNVGKYNFLTFSKGRDMLVTVKPKFQVTIPAKLRKRVDLHEGDLMEVSIVEEGILLRPKDVIDRTAITDHDAAIFTRIQPSPSNVDYPKEELVQDSIENISDARKAHHDSET